MQGEEMDRIYHISKKIHEALGWQTGKIFLFLNTVLWSLLALMVGAAGLYWITGTLAHHGVILFCIVGYTGMIIGFFGGTYYLYRKDE